MFVVKKCGKVACQFCKAFRLPPDLVPQLHYLPDPVPSAAQPNRYAAFDDIYGKPTASKHRPSLAASASTSASSGGDKAAAAAVKFNAPCARKVLRCTECGKPRVVYAQYALDPQQLLSL